MTFEPQKITRAHVLAAAEKINKGEHQFRDSTRYDALVNDVYYPPKELMRVAHEFATGEYYWQYGGGEPTNKWIRNLGFDIVEKNERENNQARVIKELIERYKSLVRSNGNSTEIYKFFLIADFQKKWDINAADFTAMYAQIDFKNLIYHSSALSTLKFFANNEPEFLRSQLLKLYNEEVDFEKRFPEFASVINSAYKDKFPNLNGGIDERTVATLMTFAYPEGYTFYKSSFYRKYCQLIGLSPVKSGERYFDYLQLVDDLISDYILVDHELKAIHADYLKDCTFKDNKYFVLAQDILYQVLDRGDVIENESDFITPPTYTDMPLNQILFGPPGTGKTYNTINRALEIINDKEVQVLDWTDRSAVKELFDKKVDTGQIIFTTFHQSMSYEDFIEGIKPEKPEAGDGFVKYKVVDGIFKDISNKAALDIVELSRLTLAEKVLSFSEAYDLLIDEIEDVRSQGNEYTFTLRNGGNIMVDGISQSDNIHIKHNKDARSYIVSKSRISKLYNGLEDFENVANINQTYRDLIGGHNASAYWAVMNVIHQKIKNNQVPTISFKNIKEEEKQEILQKVKLEDFKDQVGKPYVLIIDEINRGNISAIFGELITLLEDSKRAGRDEALEVILPYSKQKFFVPSNLYIIGTMNTADRSVEALDTALRRRFSFTEMMPDLELLKDAYVGELSLRGILEKINKRIVALLDKDHQIGHSYFINVKTLKDLSATFKNCIIPLLQEYFYHDDEKIALILGEGFVTKKSEELDAGRDLFANLSFDIRLPSVRSTYKIIPVSEDNILEAIQKL
ncbi:McrB family protein [Sphingobacterium yanglingense]|uniref:Dynein-related subfamily AAA family protein n=1 Tax=Sphingobacterium yanglingense TaxID=1437280 RepID=A0A4R6WIS4_9SPHI|nr:AAA family ATPase [Sphingobacterium yanglingense]TDQ78327.1 dynein-related subfamily AAA family protein [Sphingobacterium yanglingense]